MNRHPPYSENPKVQKQIDKIVKHNSRTQHLILHALHVIERFIAIVTIVILLAALALEIYHIIVGGAEYLSDVNHILHELLTIVVGMEFARMLVDTTPANILEVLTLAITRHVILSHDDPWSNLACVACIAGLFAIRRYLVRRSELKEEIIEVE